MKPRALHRPLLYAALSVYLGGCFAEQPARSWELAAQGFYTAALSSRAELAVVGSLNHGASLWRMKDIERLYNWSHEAGEQAQLVAAGFSPDGSRAVTTDPRTLVLWDTTNGQAINYWATPGAVLDVAVLNDNSHVLMGMQDHSAVLFNAQDGSYQHTFLHQGQVGSVAVSNNGELGLTGSDDNTAVLWSLNTHKAVHTFQHGNPVRKVEISPQGNFSFTAAQGDLVAVWDNNTGRLLHTLHNGINHGAVSAGFSADESQLAVGYANRQVALFDMRTGQRLKLWDSGTRHPMRATGAAIVEVAFTANQPVILALAGDGRLLQLRIS